MTKTKTRTKTGKISYMPPPLDSLCKLRPKQHKEGFVNFNSFSISHGVVILASEPDAMLIGLKLDSVKSYGLRCSLKEGACSLFFLS